MKTIIREIKPEEYLILQDFLYEAIYIPEGAAPIPRSIIAAPELQVYLADFGTGRADTGIIAEVNGQIIGAVWARIMNDYGHIDEETPSLAISLYKEFRGMGIGVCMMDSLFTLLGQRGYSRVSLAVQKANYAVQFYRKTGFEFVGENDEEYIMVRNLSNTTPIAVLTT